MKLLEARGRIMNSTIKARYRNFSLVKLIKRIVDKSDRHALQELHNNRTLFRFNGGPPLLFADFLNELRESTAKRGWSAPNAFEVAEKAYDLTVDKFTNFPRKNKSLPAKKKIVRKMKRKGADCRLYLKAFLDRVASSFAAKSPESQMEEETRAAMIMQGLVRRHFYLSFLEAVRNTNPFWSRYNWRVRGGTICIWLPVSLKGQERRPWLEKNIDDPDPLRSGESERIQSIIGRKLVRERFVSFSTDTYTSNEENLLPCSDSGETFGESLAGAVAKEKARNLRRQRPSIRALGKRRLKKLVLRIFEDLNCGEYEDRKIARDFGLSKATFSRFAGSRWLSTESAIPDLWQNTAEILSTHPIFKEVAIDTGVWEQVQSALKRAAPQYGEGASHD